MPVDIVAIREEHIEGFHAALDLVSREQLYLAFLQAPPLDRVRAFVAKSFVGELIQFVALDGDKIVGWCDLSLSDRETMRHSGTLGIALLPAWRGHGLGARLIETVVAAARARGLVRISLHVRADNTRAIHLYERLGFRHEGRLRRNIRIAGRDYDSLLMALLLDEPANEPVAAKTGAP